MWDAISGKSLLELKGHTSDVTNVTISADGTLVVTGSGDKAACVWDAGSGESLLELKGHKDEVRSEAFSGDGTKFVTISLDDTRVWDAKTGERIKDAVVPITPQESRWPPSQEYFAVVDGDRVRIIPRELIEIPPKEQERRRMRLRPDPLWHADQAKALTEVKNTYGAALHRSFEQNALSRLALKNGFVDQAWAHCIAAQALMPKPPSLPMIDPVPEAKPKTP